MIQLKLNIEKPRILESGIVIPAIQLAISAMRKMAKHPKRALILSYLGAGAGVLAVAVHINQFEIRLP